MFLVVGNGVFVWGDFGGEDIFKKLAKNFVVGGGGGNLWGGILGGGNIFWGKKFFGEKTFFKTIGEGRGR